MQELGDIFEEVNSIIISKVWLESELSSPTLQFGSSLPGKTGGAELPKPVAPNLQNQWYRIFLDIHNIVFTYSYFVLM